MITKTYKYLKQDKMTVGYKVIMCDECEYEYPSENDFPPRSWIFARINGRDYHFCSHGCFKYHIEQMGYPEKEMNMNVYEISIDDEEFLSLIKGEMELL